MSSTWTVKEKSQGELEVTIDGEKWAEAQKKAFNKLAKNLKVDGFRQGKVPASLVKKYISDSQAQAEAVDELANAALSEALTEHNLSPITRPTLDVPAMSSDAVTLKFIITVAPEVKLGEYKGLEIEKVDATVTDEELQREIDGILQRHAEIVVKEGDDAKVENGDLAVIDFEGFVDDVAFEGGKGEDYPLEIGSGTFIPGFEEQLVGVKAGKSKKVKVTFPENYGSADLAGKPAVFKCKVKEIKTKVFPELTEDIVKELRIPDVNTADDLRAYMTKVMGEQKKASLEQKAFDAVLDKIADSSEVEIPDVMIQEESDNLMIEFSQRLKQSGYSIDMFMQATGSSQEDIKNQMWEDASARVKMRLVLEEIAKAEGIKVEPAEIDEEYNRIATQYGMEVKKVREMARVDLVTYDLALRKASNLVKESCK